MEYSRTGYSITIEKFSKNHLKRSTIQGGILVSKSQPAQISRKATPVHIQIFPGPKTGLKFAKPAHNNLSIVRVVVQKRIFPIMNPPTCLLISNTLSILSLLVLAINSHMRLP